MTGINSNISIIGFGNFGELMSKQLILNGMNVSLFDVFDKTKEAEEIGARFVGLDEACKNKVVILAVPMENLEEILMKIKDKLTAGTLVLDVCSLKMFSCEAMKRILPNNIEVIGTHPLFGPQSAPKGIEGMRIALVNVRAKKETFDKVRVFCEKLGLKTIVTTAEEHDKQMAVSQALTHFIGQACKKINIQRVQMSTLTFDKIMDVVDIIKNDTPALFENMQTMNPFAGEMRRKFVNAANKINVELNSKMENDL